MEKLLSLILKVMNLLSKFFLLIILAKYTDPETVATFGLYWSTLVISSGMMGLEVYSYTARTIIQDNINRNLQLRKHFAFLLCIGFVGTPIISFIFGKFVTVSSIIFFIIPFHLLFEFVSQEMTRLLVPLKKPLASIVLSFIRSSLWIFPVIIAIYFSHDIQVLEFTIISWLLGSFTALLVGGIIIYKLTKGDITPIFDVQWIKNAISISLVIFIGSLCLRVILGGDRFIIDFIFDKKILAVYIFYASIVLAVVGILETSVSAWHYPSMIKSIQLNKKSEYFTKLIKFFIESTISTSLILAFLVLITPIMISTFLEPIYSQNFTAFYIMCSAIWFYTITMPFHYTIYGLGRDKTILMINVTGLVLMIVWSGTYMKEFGISGAGLMFSISLLSISLIRVFICLYIYVTEYKTVSSIIR